MNTTSTSIISIVIVTHNSAQVIRKCLDALLAHYPSELMSVYVVDSASPNTTYLYELQSVYPNIHLLLELTNVGFCRGNNIGYRASQASSSEFVLFLNPDAFVTADLLPQLIVRMSQAKWADVAVCTPLLKGYSLAEDCASGLIDSAGIGMTGYGKFFDRGQGSDRFTDYSTNTPVVAICGAFMLCRRSALNTIAPCGEVFDEQFYMYKEDIDLSLRLRRKGGRLMYCADLFAYHCRGWQGSRTAMPTWTIKRSMLNDWKVWWKFKRFLFPNSLLSFFYLCIKSLYVAIEISLLRGLLGKNR